MNNQHVDYSFIRHLEELRRRIIFCLVAVLIFSLISYFFSDKLLRLIARPVGGLVFIQPMEAFLAHIKLSFFCGLLVALPVILYHIMAFIVPGLTEKERRYIFWFLPFACLLFFAGAAFAYFIVVPEGIKFLMGFGGDFLRPMLSVGSYISFFCVMLLAFGCVFELPVVILFLTKLGIVSPASLRKNRKYTILAIFIIAAVLTPPDVFTQVIMAVPMIVLYELSILVSYLGEKR